MRCPVCETHDIDPVIYLGRMPLSVLDLQDNAKDSIAGKKYKIDIKTCRQCGHVFNAGYDPSFCQPESSGCTMYNAGRPWTSHMAEVAAAIKNCQAPQAKIVEIGAGNGEFAKLFMECYPDTDYVAFEPTADAEVCDKIVPTWKRYFHMATDLKSHEPDLLLMRHVLEHYPNPHSFLNDLAAFCRWHRPEVWLAIEVPHVQNALNATRIEDWVYEHPHHFTQNSLTTLLTRSGWHCGVRTMYNNEVLLAVCCLASRAPSMQWDQEFEEMKLNLLETREKLREEHFNRPGSVVLWGGAGKSATLINMLDLPLPVVDSDERKWGMYVPGTGQVISAPALLDHLKPDWTIVTTAWRVQDIAEEIKRENYNAGKVMYFTDGKLKHYEG